MTKLEKALTAALVVVSGTYVWTVIETMNHVNRNIEYNAKIKEGLKEINHILNKRKYVEVEQGEA